MRQNLKVTWNAMPMFVWCVRKIDGRIRDSRPKAGMVVAEIIMRDPVLRNELINFTVWPLRWKTLAQ